MSIETQIEREERDIEERYARGDISLNEYNEEMRDLQRTYSGEAQEAAQDAYDREMERW